ncbi:MAG: hypothetical protein AB7U20_21920 [Planctomycetaceae bacterium]
MPTSQPPAEIFEQLEEKDQLIQTLTERLSEVAEQLDRAQRSGGDRVGRPAAASGEILEQQRQLIESLSEAVDLWDGLQPRDAFLRIEARLDHMRTLLESAFESGVTPREPLRTEEQPQAATASSASSESPLEEPAKPQGPTGWEAMKAQLLGAGGSASPAPGVGQKPVNKPAAVPQPPADTSTAASAAEQTVRLGDNVQLPEPVDFETANREELEQAIEVRDHFIGILTRRLRNEQHRTRETVDWEALNNAPQELRARLQALEADLEDRLRIAEVELSLERARLSRIQSRVEDMQRQVEVRMKPARQQASANSAPAGRSAADADQAGSKSWLDNLRRRSTS